MKVVLGVGEQQWELLHYRIARGAQSLSPMTHGPQYIFYICYSTIHYHVVSLDVTLGYPKMVCSQVFRVYRHVMIRRLVRNARKSSNPILRNLSSYYTTT